MILIGTWDTSKNYWRYLDKNKNVIYKVSDSNIIPENTEWIQLVHASTFDIYEILLIDEPSIIFVENGIYPTLTATGIEPATGYNKVKISYNSSSVQKLYSFDQITWEEYSDNEEIQIQYNQTLYAKGINSEGQETRNRTIYRNS